MTPAKPGSTAGRRRWTVLLVDEEGRVVTLPRARGWAMFLFALLVAALVAIAVLATLYQRPRLENRRLIKRFAAQQRQYEELQRERDLLVARLALAQAGQQAREPAAPHAEAAPAAGPENTAAPPAAEEPEPPAGPETDAPEESEAVTAAESLEPAPAATPESPSTVDVDNFEIQRAPDNEQLRVQFKLVNTTGDEEPVSGHTVVVLKAPSLPPSRWLSLPTVPLVDGRPKASKRGRYFAIARFNYVRFPAGPARKLKGFTEATVFVYAEGGDLLLEKNFPIVIPSGESP